MTKKAFGKKGSYTVFLVMFMSGMIIMSSAVINASHKLAIDSSCEDLGRVWAGSILGDYDRKLRERYGFYGYIGNEDLTREKLIRYADFSFKKKKYIKLTSLECSLKEYKLTDLETFRDQMKKAAIGFWSPVPLGDDSIPNSDEADGVTGASNSGETSGGRKITAGWIIGGLPSRNYSGKPLKGSGGSSLMESAYIFKSFKDHVDDRDLGKTFFDNEIEYILTGKPDDEKARKLVYAEILAERNALNVAYLYSCTEKRQAALEAAELITPGPEAVLTQALILEVWALLEARNDLAILYDGKQVPLIKRDDNWALELSNAVEKVEDEEDVDGELDTRESKKYVRPKRIEGERYSDYLKTLLIAVPEKKRLLRVMDLIQINMKYAYCDYFLMDDLYVGLDYTMVINGKEHLYHDEYK